MKQTKRFLQYNKRMGDGNTHTGDTTLQKIFEENSSVLDDLIAILESSRKDHKDQAFTSEEKKILDAANKLLENNKRIAAKLKYRVF